MTFTNTEIKLERRLKELQFVCLPAALGDCLVNGFVNLLVVVVLVSGVLPHVGFERWRVTAHIAAQRASEREEEEKNK